MEEGQNRAAVLKGLIERVETLNQKISGLSADRTEIFAEAKALGFNVKIMREMIKMRKIDKEKLDEQETLRDRYMNILGLI